MERVPPTMRSLVMLALMIAFATGGSPNIVHGVNSITMTGTSAGQHLPSKTTLNLIREVLMGLAPDRYNESSHDVMCGETPGVHCNDDGEVESLLLTGQQMNGFLPDSICQITTLKQVDLSSNKLGGTIPSCVGKLHQLEQLNLHSNRLSGTIPAEIGQLKALVQLQMTNNQLSGTIPAEIGQLTALQRLGMHNNQLSGTILAGSERLKKSEAQGHMAKEAIEINKSLTALGDVIEALTKKQKQIPYRNHKLTQIMQDSLGGSSKTLMFVNCSPASSNVDETTMSLKYATRAKDVTNKAVRSSMAQAKTMEVK